MGYVTAQFYKDTYQGNSIPDEVLQSMLDKASAKVDLLTRMAIKRRGGFSRLSEFEQTQVQLATCHQADYLPLKASMEGVSSYSIGDVSVSYGEVVGTHDSECLALLNSTRLMYRGL